MIDAIEPRIFQRTFNSVAVRQNARHQDRQHPRVGAGIERVRIDCLQRDKAFTHGVFGRLMLPQRGQHTHVAAQTWCRFR